MDWFPELHPSRKAECQLTEAIRALHTALQPGGRAFWRSAAVHPWYARLFEENGFKVEPIAVRFAFCSAAGPQAESSCLQLREIGTARPIDNVNMYASFYKAVKV